MHECLSRQAFTLSVIHSFSQQSAYNVSSNSREESTFCKDLKTFVHEGRKLGQCNQWLKLRVVRGTGRVQRVCGAVLYQVDLVWQKVKCLTTCHTRHTHTHTLVNTRTIRLEFHNNFYCSCKVLKGRGVRGVGQHSLQRTK